MKDIIIMKKSATKANKIKFNFSTTSHVGGLNIEQNIKNGTLLTMQGILDILALSSDEAFARVFWEYKKQKGKMYTI